MQDISKLLVGYVTEVTPKEVHTACSAMGMVNCHVLLTRAHLNPVGVCEGFFCISDCALSFMWMCVSFGIGVGLDTDVVQAGACHNE